MAARFGYMNSDRFTSRVYSDTKRIEGKTDGIRRTVAARTAVFCDTRNVTDRYTLFQTMFLSLK